MHFYNILTVVQFSRELSHIYSHFSFSRKPTQTFIIIKILNDGQPVAQRDSNGTVPMERSTSATSLPTSNVGDCLQDDTLDEIRASRFVTVSLDGSMHG